MWSLEVTVYRPHIRRSDRWVVLGVASILAGCSLGPRYKRPDIAPPATWQGTTQSGSVQDISQQTWPSLEWWRAFNSSQLNELITEARSANDDLAAAIARVDEADAQAQIAGAALLPSVGAGTDANRPHAFS